MDYYMGAFHSTRNSETCEKGKEKVPENPEIFGRMKSAHINTSLAVRRKVCIREESAVER